MPRYYLLLSFIVLACSGKSHTDNKVVNPDKAVVCFIYHRFGDSRYPSTNVAVKDFEQHLRYLSENDFQVLSLSNAMSYLESDEPLKKTVVLTIDDGYKSFYENALPLLIKYKMPATLFINTQTVGGSDYMNWIQLKEVKEANIEIGNHTHSHAYFLNEQQATRYNTFEDEIRESQKMITENLKVTPTLFAYPYGEFDEGMKGVVKQMGFTCAAAQYSGVLYHGTDQHQLPRFPMAEAYSDLKMFAEKANMKPLRIINESTTNTILTDDLRPKLTISFKSDNLQIDRLQCFVQGNDCESQITETDTVTSVSVRSSKDMNTRRRTLYTLTIPDDKGNWYWYSHLWINTSLK